MRQIVAVHDGEAVRGAALLHALLFVVLPPVRVVLAVALVVPTKLPETFVTEPALKVVGRRGIQSTEFWRVLLFRSHRLPVASSRKKKRKKARNGKYGKMGKTVKTQKSCGRQRQAYTDNV
jgi:hypothetical protein